jgi:RNA polymerase sporulation-specific sigma factor
MELMGRDVSGLSDEELLSGYKAGDEETSNELFARYMPLIVRKASVKYIVGGDRDDLIQEGLIGLMGAVQGYDDARGATFRTFAETCIERKMNTAIKSANRKKNIPLNESLSLDAPVYEGEEQGDYSTRLMDIVEGNDVANPEMAYIGREQVENLREAAVKNLSHLELQVYGLMLHGYDNGYIANAIGKSEKSVDNAKHRIKEKLRRFL